MILISGWRDLQAMIQIGRNWAAATVQSRWRGRAIRDIVRRIWSQAEEMADHKIAEDDRIAAEMAAKKAAEEEAARLAAMGEVQSTDPEVVVAPVPAGSQGLGTHEVRLGLPPCMDPAVRELGLQRSRFILTATLHLQEMNALSHDEEEQKALDKTMESASAVAAAKAGRAAIFVGVAAQEALALKPIYRGEVRRRGPAACTRACSCSFSPPFPLPPPVAHCHE